MKRFLIFFSFLIAFASLQAQTPEMADTMRSEGKIYVVVAILLIVLFGLIAFLIFTDRKVSRIEKVLENKS